jgi:hypothetical protein
MAVRPDLGRRNRQSPLGKQWPRSHLSRDMSRPGTSHNAWGLEIRAHTTVHAPAPAAAAAHPAWAAADEDRLDDVVRLLLREIGKACGTGRAASRRPTSSSDVQRMNLAEPRRGGSRAWWVAAFTTVSLPPTAPANGKGFGTSNSRVVWTPISSIRRPPPANRIKSLPPTAGCSEPAPET